MRSLAKFLFVFVLMGFVCPSFAQHFDYYYSYRREGAQSFRQHITFERGMISVDIEEKQMVIRRANDSSILTFKKSSFQADRNAWRLEKKNKDNYICWTAWDIYLTKDNQVDRIETSFKTQGDDREFFDSGYYYYPPLDFKNKLSLLLKKPNIPAGTLGDIRNDEFAFYDAIIHNKGLKIYSTINKRGDTLVITQPDNELATDHTVYSLLIDKESYYLVHEPKRNGTFFIATDPADSSLRYDFVWGNNEHIDHSEYVLEMAVYRNNVFQRLEIFANERSDERNDVNYRPYVAPVEGACPACHGKGYELTPVNCRRCHGSGQRKTWTYRASDKVVKTDIHSDGSRTITYLPAGSSTSYYGCDHCKGTGRELLTCGTCRGTGKVIK